MQRLFGERVPFTGIIAQQNTLSVFNDFCLSLYLSQLKSSTQEYMQSIKEPIIEEKYSYILIHIRLDIGMFVDFCSSVARGEGGGGWGSKPSPHSFSWPLESAKSGEKMENGILSPSSLNSLRGIKLFAPLPSIDFGLALDDCENISISLD